MEGHGLDVTQQDGGKKQGHWEPFQTAELEWFPPPSSWHKENIKIKSSIPITNILLLLMHLFQITKARAYVWRCVCVCPKE